MCTNPAWKTAESWTIQHPLHHVWRRIENGPHTSFAANAWRSILGISLIWARCRTWSTSTTWKHRKETAVLFIPQISKLSESSRTEASQLWFYRVSTTTKMAGSGRSPLQGRLYRFQSSPWSTYFGQFPQTSSPLTTHLSSPWWEPMLPFENKSCASLYRPVKNKQAFYCIGILKGVNFFYAFNSSGDRFPT